MEELPKCRVSVRTPSARACKDAPGVRRVRRFCVPCPGQKTGHRPFGRSSRDRGASAAGPLRARAGEVRRVGHRPRAACVTERDGAVTFAASSPAFLLSRRWQPRSSDVYPRDVCEGTRSARPPCLPLSPHMRDHSSVGAPSCARRGWLRPAAPPRTEWASAAVTHTCLSLLC